MPVSIISIASSFRYRKSTIEKLVCFEQLNKINEIIRNGEGKRRIKLVETMNHGKL